MTDLSHDGGRPEDRDLDRAAALFNISTQSFDLIANQLYDLEPLVNRLRDPRGAARADAIRQLPAIHSRYYVNLIKPFRLDPDPRVQDRARAKLKQIESFYRRKFFFFQSRILEQPSEPGYRLGYAVTCLRYAQVWVRQRSLQEYFLTKALKHLNRIIRTFEPRLLYFYYRGQVHAMLRSKRLAISDFNKVLTEKPNHLGSTIALIRLYYSVHEPHAVVTLVDAIWSKKLPPALARQLASWRPGRAA